MLTLRVAVPRKLLHFRFWFVYCTPRRDVHSVAVIFFMAVVSVGMVLVQTRASLRAIAELGRVGLCNVSVLRDGKFTVSVVSIPNCILQLQLRR